MELLPGGEGRVVKPEERQEFVGLVRRARMTEFTKQVQYSGKSVCEVDRKSKKTGTFSVNNCNYCSLQIVFGV